MSVITISKKPKPIFKGESNMYQELQYLREEHNQICGFHCEQTNKVISTVLITWGGILALLGTAVANFNGINQENVDIEIKYTILCFIGATIFFISNVILYIFARKYYDAADSIFEKSAYFITFYEKQPRCLVEENYCWELANFDIEDNNKNRRKKDFYKNDDEYKILILCSLVLITIISFLLASIMIHFKAYSIEWSLFGIIRFFLLLLCVFYISFSIHLYFAVQKYTSLKDVHAMKATHLIDFFQYALKTGRYTKQDIENRFGDIYEKCERYLKKKQDKNKHKK